MHAATAAAVKAYAVKAYAAWLSAHLMIVNLRDFSTV
jgi:hypothetical protein